MIAARGAVKPAAWLETIMPVTGKPAEVHYGVNRNSALLRFPPIIKRIRKSPEQVPANLRLFDYWPGRGRCEHSLNGSFDLSDKGRRYERRCVIKIIACGSFILVRCL